MSLDITKNFIPIESVVNPITTREKAIDKFQPLTYIEWVPRVRGSVDDDLTVHYNSYLREWASVENLSKTASTSLITTQYRTLLKDISLNYTTDEEKRFLTNINHDDPRHVESAIPFYVNKIKQITLFYARERDVIKQQKKKRSESSTPTGIKREVHSTIATHVLAPDIKNLGSTGNIVLTSPDKALDYTVNIEETYDLSQSYFKGTPLPMTRSTFDSDAAIIASTLRECAPTLQLPGINLVLTGQVTTTTESSNLLKSYNYSEFFNYIKDENNLNRLRSSDYINTILGSDVMLLSSGNITKLSNVSAPWRNIFNRYTPTINNTPDKDQYKTLQEIGGFFTPKKLGILTYYSKSPLPIVTDDNITQIIPDVSRYGSSTFSGISAIPIEHSEDISWLKADNSNGQLFGDIIPASNFAKFSGYTSADEIISRPQVGVSRSTDDLDFFTGEKKNQWSQSDIFPLEGPNIFDIDKRVDTLLTGHSTTQNWRTDLFGNEYALFKQTQRSRKPMDTGYGQLNSDDQIEAVVGCQVIDGGDTLGPRPDMYDNFVEYDIYEGGRAPGIDNKFEQSRAPRAFLDLRRRAGFNEFNQPLLEEHNSYYVGIDPSIDRVGNSVARRPVTFHGFFKSPTFDEQAYGGLFTDEACGVIDPSSFKCEILDSYAFNTSTDEVDDNGMYISSHYPVASGIQDTYEQYLNEGTSDVWEELAFVGDENTQNITVDGALFNGEFCSDKVEEYKYNVSRVPYFEHNTSISLTKYSEEVDDDDLDLFPTIYEQNTQLTGEAYFRNYNGSKITPLSVAMSDVIGNFNYFENSEHDIVFNDITSGNILDLDILYDNIIISTPSHILVEKINYSQDQVKIKSNNTTNVLIRTASDNPLEISTGWFFNEDTSTLLMGNTTTQVISSQTVVYPRLYIVDMKTLEYTQAFPNDDYSTGVEDFMLTENLSEYTVKSIDKPIIKFNEKTDVYNVSYSAVLSGAHDDIYCVFTNNFKRDKLNLRLIDACVYHGNSVNKYIAPGAEWAKPVTSRTIRLQGNNDLIPTGGDVNTQSLSLSSMLGYSLSGYSLDIEINTHYIPVNPDGFKIIQLMYDPGDGSDIISNTRTLDESLDNVSVDITTIPDQSDFGDPRISGFTHRYIFEKPTEFTYTAQVSAVYSDYSKIVYKLNIETEPYSVQSAFNGVKLIDSKLFTNKSNVNKQLLVLETQSPRYVSNIIIDR